MTRKRQQILALGRLGWSLRRIEETTAVRRETASAYLKAAGIAVRGRGGRAGVWPPKPATTPPEVSTDPARQNRPPPRQCPPTLTQRRELVGPRARAPASRTAS